MLNINYSIDFIQETKKQFVRSTVSDERIKAGLLNFVDKQTELCKIEGGGGTPKINKKKI